MAMDNQTLEQFSRQMLVDEIGYDGQERILNTRVAVTGSYPWLDWTVRYLTAAGLSVDPQRAVEGMWLRVQAMGGSCREIRLSGSYGAQMTRLGLELAVFLRDVATKEEE